MTTLRRLLLTALLALPAVPAQAFLGITQGADGSWPVVAEGGQAEAEVAVHALVLLAMVADGSTPRAGPWREAVRGTLRWLVAQQDAEGRFRLAAEPEWLADHALATYAVAEALRSARWKRGLRTDALLAAVDVLRHELTLARPAPASLVRWWTELLILSLRRQAREFPIDGAVLQTVPSLHEAADGLAAALQALPPLPADEPMARALAGWRGAAVGAPWPWAANELPPDWPADPLAEPMVAFCLAVAAFRQGGEAWRTVQAALQVWDRRGPRPDQRGSFAAVGAFGSRHGRLGSGAVRVLLLTVYFRYCRLALE